VHDLLFKSIVDLLPPSLDALLAFLRASPSPFHAVAQAASRLDGAGFVAVAPVSSWRELPPKGYASRDGALVAWASGGSTPPGPFRVIGAHTDSPNLRLKPRPDTGVAGWRQLAIEVYGGALVNSWLDRDLGVSGRVVTGSGETALVHIDRPLARVAQLAIHLDRDVNERGLLLDKQQHLTRSGVSDRCTRATSSNGSPSRPVSTWPTSRDGTHVPRRHRAGAPRTRLRVRGVGSSRQLVSCWGLEALSRSDPATVSPSSRCSTTRRWARLDDGRRRSASSRRWSIAAGAGAGGDDDDRHRSPRRCACPPTWPTRCTPTIERHEPAHRPVPNGGPVVKMNVNQRYATNAVTARRFTSACERAGVPWQVFVSRNNMPCGSTIGPITATRLGIDTVDVGCAQLSMHSARELCGADDPPMLARALHALLTDG
jgi:aspartyl aminopeptidase